MIDESVTEKNILKRLKKLQKKTGQAIPELANLPPEPVDERTAAVKEIDAIVAKSAVKEKKDKLRKKRIIRGIQITVVSLLGYGIYLLFVPFQGGPAFGVCKIFLELNARFPTMLRLSTVEEFATSVRIWYTEVDSFGEYKLQPIQCYFKPDEVLGLVVDKITIDRRDVDPVKVEDFNRSLPVVLQNLGDLTLPSPLPDSLDGLKIETEKFLKPILDRMPY